LKLLLSLFSLLLSLFSLLLSLFSLLPPLFFLLLSLFGLFLLLFGLFASLFRLQKKSLVIWRVVGHRCVEGPLRQSRPVLVWGLIWGRMSADHGFRWKYFPEK
jgi:hypothetical protein